MRSLKKAWVKSLDELYAYRVVSRGLRKAERELAAYHWDAARIALATVRIAPSTEALAPYCLALHHRRRAREAIRRARGEIL